MANIIREDKYIKTDHEVNNNKFWYITEFDDCSILVQFGRIGKKTQSRPKNFDSQEEAAKFYDKKCKQKEKGKKNEIPYRKLDVVAGTTAVSSTSFNLEKIVEDQIKSNSKETRELLRYFIQKNIHNIIENTTITYNTSTGLFETPCGPVTQKSIDEAKVLLNSINKFMNREDRIDRKFGKLVSEYLMLIPMDLGMKFNPLTLFSSVEDIKKQEGILESLEFTYETIISNNQPNDVDATEEAPKVFDCDFELVEDKSVIKHINDLYYDTRQTKHVCYKMKPKRIFKVRIGKMDDKFQAKGKTVGNIKELWHGTNDGNIISIMKGGLIIPKSNAGHCTGRMFGNGIYFSDQSTKALNYAAGYWDRSRNKRCFMFLADVAMGKEYIPRGYGGSSLPRSGYDSTFAKGGQSGVLNNEMIVYKLEQANLKYLVEFE